MGSFQTGGILLALAMKMATRHVVLAIEKKHWKPAGHTAPQTIAFPVSCMVLLSEWAQN